MKLTRHIPAAHTEKPTERLSTVLAVLAVALAACAAMLPGHTLSAQGFEPEPVFKVRLLPDREPLVAGEQVRLAVVVTVDRGWHINSNDPGDQFLVPTTLSWTLPEGWPQPQPVFPPGHQLKFEFSEIPIEVWQGKVVILAALTLPATTAVGEAKLRVEVTAQACNDVQCLPPTPVAARTTVVVTAAGAASTPINQSLIAEATAAASHSPRADSADNGQAGASDAERQAGKLAALPLPLLLITVLIGGLGLTLTPCVYPLIPITIGFFDQQAKGSSGGTFSLALVYVLGMSVTYSVLGVVASLAGKMFGFALGHPLVIGGIVVVMLALAMSMFGLWELRVPTWAMQASGGRAGLFGALIMGLVVGLVAAPCIGPFVLGLVTFVGQRGEPVFGLLLFFTLAMGLGLPFLLLGTFTGMISKMPASGQWMVGVRKVFGVLLIGLAISFAAPLLPERLDTWLTGLVLVIGGLYLLVLERTGHEQPLIDRTMRLVSCGMVVIGTIVLQPVVVKQADRWASYEQRAVDAAISSGQPVIIDFSADWCAPCRELDEKTFSDARVAELLEGYARFRSDQTITDAPLALQASQAHGVVGVPTVIVYRSGKELFRISGFERPEQFLKRLQP